MSSGAPETTRGRLGRIGLNIVAIIGFIYLFLPIAVIVAFSFNKPAGKFNIVWKEFTLDNWANPFESGPLMDAMGNSLKIATLAALGATILGSLIAIALVRYRFSGNAVVDVLLILPLTAPEIVLGASLLSLFLDLNWQRGFWTVVIAHVLFCTSFVALTVKARIRGFDWTLEDAAMDLGATPSVTFRRVTLPLITPGDHRRQPAVVRPVDRRLHHHVLQRGHHRDLPAADLRRLPNRDLAADQRARDGDPAGIRRAPPRRRGAAGLARRPHLRRRGGQSGGLDRGR